MMKRLEREKVRWARPMAKQVLANVELKKQNINAAKVALLDARDGFEQCSMRLFQHTAEAKLCEITGQLETARFQNVVDWFAAQEIQNPQAFTEMHYPTWGADANDHWSSYIKENGEV
jgi:hypothetical protein